jgi:hypothetical protein
VKRKSFVVKQSLAELIRDYLQGDTIHALARKANYPPYLLSRFIVEATTTLGRNKKILSEAMRRPLELITNEVITEEFRDVEQKGDSPTRLAEETMRAIDSDPIYGPRYDKHRHLAGVEFEVVLEHKLRSMGELPYFTSNREQLDVAREIEKF